MPVRVTRWINRTLSFHTWYIGIIKIAASVAIFGTALPIKRPLRYRHVPGIVGFHALGTGLHWKMQRKINTNDQTMVIVLRIHAAILNPRSGKTRQYMTRMATL